MSPWTVLSILVTGSAIALNASSLLLNILSLFSLLTP